MSDTSKTDRKNSRDSHDENPANEHDRDSSLSPTESGFRRGDQEFHEGVVPDVQSQDFAEQISDEGPIKETRSVDQPAFLKLDELSDNNDPALEGASDDASSDFSRDASFVLGKPKLVDSTSPAEERLDKVEPAPAAEAAPAGDDDDESVLDLSRDQSMDISQDSRHGIGKPQRVDFEPEPAPATKSPQWLDASVSEAESINELSAPARDGMRPTDRYPDVEQFENAASPESPAVIDESTTTGEETLNYDEDLLADSFFEGVSEDAPEAVIDDADDASQDISYDELGEPKRIDSVSPDSGFTLTNPIAAPAIHPVDASADSRSKQSTDELSHDPFTDSTLDPAVAAVESQPTPAAPCLFDPRKPFFDPSSNDAPRLPDREKALWLKAVWGRLNDGGFDPADLTQAKTTTDELLIHPTSKELIGALECLQRQLLELTAFAVAQSSTTVSSTAPPQTEASSLPSAKDVVEPDVETLQFQAEDLEFEARLVAVDSNHLHARRLFLDAAQFWHDAGRLDPAKAAIRNAERHQKRLAATWAEKHPDELEKLGRTITKHAHSLEAESRRQRLEQERERSAAIELQRQVIFSLLVTHEDAFAALGPTAQDGLSEKDRSDLAPEAMELAQIRRRLESGTAVTLDVLRRDADALNRILIAVLVRQRTASKSPKGQVQLESLGYGLSLPGPPQVDTQAGQSQKAPRSRQLFKDAYCRAFVSGLKGSADSAIRLFSTAVRQAPSEPLYRYFLGLALYRRDEPEAGLEQVQIGAQLEKDQETPPASVHHWLESVDSEQRAWLEQIRRAVMKGRGGSATSGNE